VSGPRTISRYFFVILIDDCQEFFYTDISSRIHPPFPCWHLRISHQRKPYYFLVFRLSSCLSLVLAVPSCAPVSAAAPPQRLQRCKSFCISLFKQLSSRLNQSPRAALAAPAARHPPPARWGSRRRPAAGAGCAGPAAAGAPASWGSSRWRGEKSAFKIPIHPEARPRRPHVEGSAPLVPVRHEHRTTLPPSRQAIRRGRRCRWTGLQADWRAATARRLASPPQE